MDRPHAYIVVICAAAILANGCSRRAPQQNLVLTLAADDRGRPQFDYKGRGLVFFTHSFESFTYRIGPTDGTAWITAKGEMKFSDSNHVFITIQSSSDRPYELELLGVWTNRTLDIPEDKAKERLHVPAGDQKLGIERFVIWTYDFAREKMAGSHTYGKSKANP